MSGEAHVHHDAHEVGHGTFKGYVTGFVLAAVLTALPFWAVMGDIFGDPRVTATFVMALAVVQIIVHMVYFLHMNTQSEGGWNMLAMIFTVVIVVITIAGSLWVMYHLNTNMMLLHGEEAGTYGEPADPAGVGSGQEAAPAAEGLQGHGGHDMGSMP